MKAFKEAALLTVSDYEFHQDPEGGYCGVVTKKPPRNCWRGGGRKSSLSIDYVRDFHLRLILTWIMY